MVWYGIGSLVCSAMKKYSHLLSRFSPGIEMLRSEFFELLNRKSELSAQDTSTFFLKLHDLYITGESITVDNLSDEEKEIARQFVLNFPRLQRRRHLSAEEQAKFYLKLKELYDTGERITFDNMSEEERAIGMTFDFYPDDQRILFDAGDANNIFIGLGLYRVEILPVIYQCRDDPYSVGSALIQQCLSESCFAFRAYEYLKDKRSKVSNSDINLYKQLSLEMDHWYTLSRITNKYAKFSVLGEYILKD